MLILSCSHVHVHTHTHTHVQTTFLVVNNSEKAQDSYKSRMAAKWGIPIVSLAFIAECLSVGRLVETDQFVVVGRTAAEEFSSGKIVGE